MSVKDFNRGAEAQARAHHAFMRKQGEATTELGKRIIKKINEQGNLIDVLIDELNQQEMDSVFGVYSSLDIGTLDDSDQIKLLSYLKTLSTRYGQTTQQQNDYLFTVKKYLNIGNVSDDMELESVSNLDISRTELKAFFECICEFLFLKNGSRKFMDEFEQELDAFGFSNKIINEIISNIEKTYQFFGVKGIIEHYDLQPIHHETSDEEQNEPLVIPFFQKTIVLVYSSRSKHGEIRAKMLQICIHERLKELNLECPVEIYPGDEAKKKKNIFERDNVNIIYIGEPTMSNPLSATIDKWEFDKLGMKYITRGQESIIKVKELKKKQYKEFLEFAKEQQLRQESDIKKNLKSQEDTILGTAFDKDEPLAVNIMVGILGSWLLVPSAILDLSNKADDKVKLKNLQYSIAIDKFISSKIEPYINNRK